MEIKAKKSLGQNFLKDEQVLSKIASSINTNKDDLIIEIGPGKGALTKYLKKKNTYLLGYEIDTRMKEYLNKYEDEKTKIIYEDILKTNIEETIKNIPFKNLYVIANIPYYITTPIIKKVMNLEKLESMSLLVQKEVAQRFSAKPGNKAYGSITVFLNYFFEVNHLFEVKNTCFEPIPKVDSAVILFKKRKEKRKVKQEEKLFKLIEDSFQMKRKTLKNNLKQYDWNKIKEILKNNNLEENIRAEEIPLEIFIKIANAL